MSSKNYTQPLSEKKKINKNPNLESKIISQFIDKNGKLRVLIFKNNLTLLVNPCVPFLKISKTFRLSEIKTIDQNTLSCNYEIALKFIKKYNCEIQSYKSDDSNIVYGIWISFLEKTKTTTSTHLVPTGTSELSSEKTIFETKSPIYTNGIFYAYINLENVPIITLKNRINFLSVRVNGELNVNPILEPIFLYGAKSDLNLYKKTERLVDFLKEYTLYTYSLNPENFSAEESFLINPSHKYKIDSLKKRLFFENNNIMYEKVGNKFKLIVNSENIKKRLLDYLSLELFNNKNSVLKKKEQTHIELFYKNISDFKSYPNTLIFFGIEDLKSKLTGTSSNPNKIYETVCKNYTEPYYFRHPLLLNGSICIIQNVNEGDLDSAVTVSYEWNISKKNKGYYFIPVIKENIPMLVYDLSSKYPHGDITDFPHFGIVLDYGDNSYAAVLAL